MEKNFSRKIIYHKLLLVLTDEYSDVVWMRSLLCWWTNSVSSRIILYVGCLTCYPLSQFSAQNTHIIITPSSSLLFLIPSSLSSLSSSSSP